MQHHFYYSQTIFFCEFESKIMIKSEQKMEDKSGTPENKPENKEHDAKNPAVAGAPAPAAEKTAAPANDAKKS
jgi:hypothetical protein|tara:strand:+ start:2600 stop:2818 length:219 start_codon:yes stop_codon:yes gene_type:complete